jgi:hypothetical protein
MNKRLLSIFLVLLAIVLAVLGASNTTQAAPLAGVNSPTPVPGAAPQTPPGDPALEPSGETLGPNDAVTADDLIVTGSICVGFDCLTDGTEYFSFDTMKLKENNLRILFDDTSATAGFPANDWRLIANDSASGGANYFALEDATGAKIPLKVMGGAPANSLLVAANGNVGLGVAAPAERLHVDGNILVNGYVKELSDRSAKTAFAPVNGAEVLAKLARVPVTSWSYIDEAGVRHVGPMAQDFYAAFGLGQDDTHLAALDVNGISLAAIQELDEQVKVRDAQIAALEGKLGTLEMRLAALETGTAPAGAPGWLPVLVVGLLGLGCGITLNRRKQ